MYEFIINLSSCNVCISLTVKIFIVLNSGEVCSLYLLCAIICIAFFEAYLLFHIETPILSGSNLFVAQVMYYKA